MNNFFLENWSSILLSLCTAGALAFCRYFYKQMQNYRTLLEQNEMKTTEQLIERKIEPILVEIEELRKYIMRNEENENKHLELIISSYRFRLVQLCKVYLSHGSITSSEYEQLSEFFKVYSGLGGNGQAKEYYEKVLELPLRSEDKDTKED